MEEHPKYQIGPEPDVEPELEHWPTTNELVATVHANRTDEPYPTPEMLLHNLPVVLRAMCDFTLSGHADAYDIAYTLASIIDVLENLQPAPPDSVRKPH